MAAAAFVAAAALPGASADPSKELEEDARGLMHYTVTWDECVGKILPECQAIIEESLEEHPEVFGHLPAFNFEVSNIRSPYDENYNMVGLRTDEAGERVVGVLNDGMIWYNWEWCTDATTCHTLGPWDCDVGLPLTVEECCKMITDTVPGTDLNGNELTCYNDYPVGSPQNPVDESRVLIHVNGNNVVVHPPRNE